MNQRIGLVAPQPWRGQPSAAARPLSDGVASQRSHRSACSHGSGVAGGPASLLVLLAWRDGVAACVNACSVLREGYFDIELLK